MPQTRVLTSKLAAFMDAEVLAKFDFTPDEESCISAKIEKLKSEGKLQDQAVAIAIETCAPTKAKAQAVALVGTFAADRINIKGADHRWADTKDGYFTVFDVPLVSACTKGTKGAPYDVDKAKLEQFRDVGQQWYQQGKFCGRAFVGHNPDIPLTHPDQAGYVLPNRVGSYKFGDGSEKETLFGDLKLDKAHFEHARAGKLPCHSVEVVWTENRVSGLAFLDTLDPHYKYSMFTLALLGDENAPAKFEARDSRELAKFLHDRDEAKKPEKDNDDDGGEGDFAEKYPAVHKKMGAYDAAFGQFAEKLGLKFDFLAQKPSALPTEPNRPMGPGGAAPANQPEEGKMGMTTEETAKFMAMVNDNAEMKAKFLALERKDKSDALLVKIDALLREKIVSPELRADFSERARIAVTEEKGDEKLLKAVESLKPNLKTKPTEPGHFGGGASAGDAASNPIVAKFVAKGIDGGKIARFSAEYREQIAANPRLTEPVQMGSTTIPGLTEEAFIENCLSNERWQNLKREARTKVATE